MHQTVPILPAYGWMMLIGIGASFLLWKRIATRDRRLTAIYIAALLGAFFGAKIVYLLAEAWFLGDDPQRWMKLATGKSILGALLGGYAGVEIAKRATGYSQATGDLFALVVPPAIILGRIGCVLHGCCLGNLCERAWFTDAQGIPRWPAAQVELAFNLFAVVCLCWLRAKALGRNQLFHLYMIGYGVFRFFHEFWRETPALLGRLTGYQAVALALAAFGTVAFALRQRKLAPAARSTAA